MEVPRRGLPSTMAKRAGSIVAAVKAQGVEECKPEKYWVTGKPSVGVDGVCRLRGYGSKGGH